MTGTHFKKIPLLLLCLLNLRIDVDYLQDQWFVPQCLTRKVSADQSNWVYRHMNTENPTYGRGSIYYYHYIYW